MRLRFEPPSSLPATARVSVLHPTAGTDLAAWLATQVGAGSDVRKLSHQATTSSRGWPVELISYGVDGGLVIVAAYVFIDLTATVAIAGLDRADLAQYERELVAALLAAEPDWITDEPRTIAELWLEPARP